MNSYRASLALVVTLAIFTFAPAAAQAAPVSLKIVKSAKVAVAGNADTYFAFADGPTVSQSACGSGFVPMAVGWKGLNVPVSGVGWYVNSAKPNTTSYGYRISIARPLANGSMQAHTLCAKGPVSAKRKEGKQGTAVSCGTKTALGYLNLVNVKQEAAVSTVPSGRSGWVQNAAQSDYSKSSAVCVDKAAFTSIKRVSKSATFEIGKRTATAIATCAKGSRAIGWGFSAPVMLTNKWAGDGEIHAPFVESAVPAAASWAVTFSTPNLQGALEATSVTAWAVCGKPRTK